MNVKIRNTHSLVIGILMLGVLAGAHSPVALGQTTLQWKPGDSWQVGAWYGQIFRPEERAQLGDYKLRGQMIVVSFQVTSIKPVGQTPCFEVQATYPREETGFQRRYQVYYCQANGNLVRIKDISLLPDGTTKDLTFDSPADAKGPAFLDDVAGVVPLEWPNLASPDVAPQADPAGATAQTTVPAASRAVQQEDEITLTKSSDRREAKVTQRWRKGEPWWRVARKYEGGKLVGEAILLEVNGQTIATMPAGDQ